MKVPSVEWFEALGAEMAGPDAERHRQVGEIDLCCVWSITDTPEGDQHYRLRFEELALVEVERLGPDADLDALTGPDGGVDFVLEGDHEDWLEMVEHLRTNGRPDREHTLNYLSMPGIPLRCWATDPLGRDMFFRFNQSLQLFVNAAGRLPVSV